MNKPSKKTVTHYVYRDIIKYIEDTHNIKTRDYYGCHNNSNGQPWSGEMEKDYAGKPCPPYADFWHWMISCNEHLTNGSYINFPDDWREMEVSDGVEAKGFNCIPRFCAEILELLEKEFGREITIQNIWVDW